MQQKLNEWIRRYLPAELVSIATTLLAAIVVYSFTHSHLLAAIAGTWGENIGYYGFLTFQEVRNDRNRYSSRRRYGIFGLLKSIRNLILEFGIAEWIDSGLVRPLLLYILPQALGNLALGVVAGKIAADLVFYLFAITAYELRKKYLKP